MTSDKLLDSPSTCLVFNLETKGEFDVTSRVTLGLIPRIPSMAVSKIPGVNIFF